MTWPQLDAVWRSAWKPPEKYTPSDWAERNFVLPMNGNAEPGKFRFARTPYLRGIVDSIVEPGVEDVVFLKPTRVGGTTAGQIMLGYWIDNDPGPCITVMPSETAVEQEIKERVRPMLESCPTLAEHVSPRPHDNTLGVIKLDTMTLYFGWSGSPQSLASNTCRYARFDEVDKFVPFAGREADPISLGKERTATYLHRKRHYITSTPTTRAGAIWRQWEACGDRRHFHVPCPHCGTYQQLAWSQVKWIKLDISDKIRRADEIERAKLAWYECSDPECKGRIEDSHKPKMLERGVWLSEGQAIDKSGVVSGERQHSKRIGFHLSSLYSPWRTFAEMAAEFIRAEGDLAATMNFRNSRLAEPFEQQISKTEPSQIRAKADNKIPAKVVPKWARALIATADTQQDHFYYTIRAWGYEYRSQLVDYGSVSTFEELKAKTIDAPFPIEGGNLSLPQMLLIDSGGGKSAETGTSRTNEVYQFVLTDRGRIIPTKGASGALRWPVDKSIQKAHGLVLWSIDTNQCKDTLNRLVHDEDKTKWMLCESVNDDYCSQMSSEHKIVDPRSKRMLWEKKTSGAQNHYFDCETLQCAAAWEIGAGNVEPQQVATVATPKLPARERPSWIPERPNDWMRR